MKAAILLSGREARLRGLYELGDFPIEGEEKEYDNGLWVWAPGEYAEWYCSDLAEELSYKLDRKSGIKEEVDEEQS